MKECSHVNNCSLILPFIFPSLSNSLEFHFHTCPSSCCYMLARYSYSQSAYTICFQRSNSPLGFHSDLPLVIGLKASREGGARSRREQASFCELPASGVVFWESPFEWRLFSFSKGGGSCFCQPGRLRGIRVQGG